MKTSITSNWRPLLRAFYPFLIAFAVLWAVPRNAHAQDILYVAHAYYRAPAVSGALSAYNATTGAFIRDIFKRTQGELANPLLASNGNTVFFSEGQILDFGSIGAVPVISRTHYPTGLACDGNTLFEAEGVNVGAGKGTVSTVAKYNVHTGELINDSFISGLRVDGLAVNGNTLFVANRESNTIGAYNATTGELINASFISGLADPKGLAVWGNTLFVLNSGTGTVGKYDATTGGAINASLITGLTDPKALAVFSDTIFVVNRGTSGSVPFPGAVGKYNATTGAAINPNFITGLNLASGIAIKSAK